MILTIVFVQILCMMQAGGLGGGYSAATIVSHFPQSAICAECLFITENSVNWRGAPIARAENKLKALANAGAVNIIEGPLGQAYEYNREEA